MCIRDRFEAELEVRKAEIRLQELWANEELALHKQELARQRARDDQQSERETSLASQIKRYGDIKTCVASYAARPWRTN